MAIKEHVQIGVILHPTSGRRFPILEVQPKLVMVLQGEFGEFESRMTSAVLAGYDLQSADPSIHSYWKAAQTEAEAARTEIAAREAVLRAISARAAASEATA